jgi:hypothetical protein
VFLLLDDTKTGKIERNGVILMYEIELIKQGSVVETHSVGSTMDLAEIERLAQQLRAQCVAEGWHIVNETGRIVRASGSGDRRE